MRTEPITTEPTPLVMLSAINARYSGQFDKLDFMDPEVKAQLALDLGFLIGLSLRWMQERDKAKALLAELRDGISAVHAELRALLPHA